MGGSLREKGNLERSGEDFGGGLVFLGEPMFFKKRFSCLDPTGISLKREFRGISDLFLWNRLLEKKFREIGRICWGFLEVFLGVPLKRDLEI